MGLRRHARADEGGFTLIEVLAAMVVFIVVSTATVSILILALRTVRENDDRVQAANIARSQVDAMRFLGAASIPKGLTIGGPAGTDSSFTVRTTANWVGLGQQVSACEAAEPGQAYVRVHVEVTSANLSGPQVIDTVVAPEGSQTLDGTGAATVAVVDQLGGPVSDVVVRALDSIQPTNAFTLTTGSDGCLFLPGLKPTGSLSVTVSRTGYVPSTPTGTQQTLQVTAGSVTRSTFELAAQSTIAFGTVDEVHALPSAMPVSWQLNTTGSSPATSNAGGVVTALWPNTNGFTSWAGACADSNPAAYGVTRQSFAFIAGQTTHAALLAVPLKLRGLPAGALVTGRYAGSDAACVGQTVALGAAGELGVLRIAMPYGNWTFVTPGQTQALTSALEPTPDGSPLDEVVVNFTLADLDNPSPSATATPSGTPSPTPSGGPT